MSHELSRPAGARRFEAVITAGSVDLPGDLILPDDASAIVIFAHGSGSSRQSPRNVLVADHLNRHGLATLLFDLLSPSEAADQVNVFDIAHLARRLTAATAWVGRQAATAQLPVGWFGASTGAAAALWAAAEPGAPVRAIVSRGGRPDLAQARLAHVVAPTLLIVGGEDHAVLALNQRAARDLPGPVVLQVVPGASHLFEEPGALERVAELAATWFTRYLRAGT